MTKEQLNQHPAWAGERDETRVTIERRHPRQCLGEYCSATYALGLSDGRVNESKHIRRLKRDEYTKH